MKKIAVFVLCSMFFLSLAACSSNNSHETAERILNTDSVEDEQDRGEKVQIAITIGETVIYADMYDTELAKEFIALLPQKIAMQRVGGGREFYGSLKGSLHYDEADSQTTFENGEIAYWYSGNGLCLLYDNQVEEPEIDSGIIVMGKMTSDYSVLHEIGDEIEVTVSIAGK